MEVVLGLDIRKTGPTVGYKAYAIGFHARIRGHAPADCLAEFTGSSVMSEHKMQMPVFVGEDEPRDYGEFDKKTWDEMDIKPTFSTARADVRERDVFEDLVEVITDLAHDFSGRTMRIVVRTVADIAHIAFKIDAYGLRLPEPFVNGDGLMRHSIATDTLLPLLPADVSAALGTVSADEIPKDYTRDAFIACNAYIAFRRGMTILAGHPSGGMPAAEFSREAQVVCDIVNSDSTQQPHDDTM